MRNLDSFQMGVSQVCGRNDRSICESRMLDSVTEVSHSCPITEVLCPITISYINGDEAMVQQYKFPFHQFFTFQPPPDRFSHTARRFYLIPSSWGACGIVLCLS